MAIAFVAETFATEAAVATTEAVTPGNTAGNLLVLGIAARGSAALQSVSSVADTGGNTWAKVPSGFTTSGNLDCEVWWTLSTAVAGTVTVTLSGLCSTVLSCVEFSGASSIDIAKAASGTSAAPATGTTAATGHAAEAVFAFVGSLSTTAFSAQTAGYTTDTQHTSTISGLNCSAQTAYKILSATGTQSYGLTAGNNSWCAIIVTFYSAGSTALPLAANGAIGTTGTAPLLLAQALAASGAAALAGTAGQAEALALTDRGSVAASAWARVAGSATTATANYSTSCALTPGANITLGNRMIVVCQWYTGGVGSANPTISDAAGNVWSLDVFPGSLGGYGLYIWSAPITAGGGTKPVITVAGPASSDFAMTYAEYSGIGSVDVTVENWFVPSASATTTATAATAAANELVIAGIGNVGSTNTLTDTSGDTTLGLTDLTATAGLLAVERNSGVVGTPQTVTATQSTVQDYWATIAVYTLSPSAGGGMFALTGTANLSAVGLTAIAATGQSAMSGTGALAVSKALALAGAAALSGTAAPSQAVALGAAGTAALTGTANLAQTLAVALAASGAAALTGAGTLSLTTGLTLAATGQAALIGTAAPQEATALALAGTAALTGTAAPAEVVALSATGTIATQGQAPLTVGSPIALAASGSISMSGSAQGGAKLALSGGGGIAALGGAGSLAQALGLAGKGTATLGGTATPTWTATLGATGHITLAGKAGIHSSAGVSLAATGTVAMGGTAPLLLAMALADNGAGAVTETIIVPAYIYPGSGWNGLAASAPTVSIAVANPASGPGSSYASNVAAQIATEQAAGIVMYGYVDTDYGGRTIAAVESDVALWASFYGITNIFFDRVTTDAPTEASFYAPLYAYVHAGGGNVILNCGVAPDQSYMAASDVLVTFEGDYPTYLSSYSAPAWMALYAPGRFWNIVYSVPTIANMGTVVALASQRGIGAIYATDAGLPNPYSVLPSYLANEVAVVSAPAGTPNGIVRLVGNAALFFALPYAPGVVGSPAPAVRGSATATNIVGSPQPAIRGSST